MARNCRESIAYLEEILWQGKPKCPYCGSECSTSIDQGVRYHCNACYTSYSVTVGTFFHRTHVDLHKWFQAISLILNSKVSVRQLAQEVGVSKNTAAHMIRKTRTTRKAEDLELLQMIAAKQRHKGQEN